ncbi:YgfZ/GcvT domain-containing protein [Propionimicrobium lymphophilum]|uniref:CAF17-like 4Fe-4S cluster assembly/insertion protein YgfZ n=1 Tax=Propionimicrobium lymphophilum TaxID=33012 RepID=UPI0003FC7398|nr:folate-binding protein YgfZ [Propionimicrobium lymphophilum]
MIEVEHGPDKGLAWHFGDPLREQRELLDGRGVVDLGNGLGGRCVLELSGLARCSWLSGLSTDTFDEGRQAGALILDGNGHVLHRLHVVDDGETAFVWADQTGSLLEFLQRMKFWTKVEISVSKRHAFFVGNDEEALGPEIDYGIKGGRIVLAFPDAYFPNAGVWAFEALRIDAGLPRIGADTDDKTIPNELGLYATKLDKGCYPGQETVARVHNVGRPPRRMIRLLIDGSENRLPELGAPIFLHGSEKPVGFVGASEQHWELGPIALGLIKRSTPVEAQLTVDGIAASQEVLVDPEIGIHFKAPKLGGRGKSLL